MLKHLYAILDMGNYGWYVWPCYLLFALVCVIHLYLAVKDQKSLVKKFRANNEPRT